MQQERTKIDNWNKLHALFLPTESNFPNIEKGVKIKVGKDHRVEQLQPRYQHWAVTRHC